MQRVPITWPPEKLWGVLLSAMCVPDLRGTQGMFSFYTTRTLDEGEKIGGEVHHVTRGGGTVEAHLVGPPNPLLAAGGEMRLPFTVSIQGADRALLKIGKDRIELRKDVYTDWIPVDFRAAAGVPVRGVCKFLLLSTEPEFGLYVTPINIDPERPAMPVSYPSVYSVYLAKKQGTYATLGLAEDTWALNEGVLNDDHFIQQCLDMDDEREAMFLDCARQGSARSGGVCLRRHRPPPAHVLARHRRGAPGAPRSGALAGRNVIEDLYRRMDDLVGKTIEKCRDKGTMLLVISDHGFGPFRTGVDLNRWLEENGYLVVNDLRRGEEHLAAVDWSRTPRVCDRPGRHLHQREGQVRAGNRRSRQGGRSTAERDRRPA